MLFPPAFKFILTFVVGYLVTYFLAPIVMKAATSLGAIDWPDERRIHSTPTPRGGGVAVFVGFHVACGFIFIFEHYFPWYLHNGTLNFDWWIHFLIASGLILLVGIVDDLFDMNPIFKLSGQIIAAVMMFSFGTRFAGAFGLDFSLAFNFVATVIWFLVIINAFNLIDGYDGVAAGLAAIAALGIGGTFLFRHMPLEALFIVGFIGSCIAFLRYNFHPARVFLGDSGSMFLGFFLASITLATTSKGTGLAAIWVPLLAVGVPIFDTFLAFWRRSARRLLGYLMDSSVEGGVFSPDVDHLHHRLARIGLVPRNVAAVLYLSSSLLVFLGLLTLLFHDRAQGIFIILFVIVSYLTIRHVAASELWQSGWIVVYGLRTRPKPFLSLMAYILLDALTITGTVVAVDWSADYLAATGGILALEHLVIGKMSFLFIILLLFLDPYKTVWSKKPLSDIAMGVILILSLVFTVVGLCFGFLSEHPNHYVSILVYGGAMLCSVLCLRLIPRMVEELMLYLSKGEKERKITN